MLNDLPRLIKFSDKFLKLREKLIDFMDTNIYPNEQLFLD
jgi:hypothetical protein